MTDTSYTISDITSQSEKCLSQVRWSKFGQLQQLWEIVEYKNSRPTNSRHEWRNVQTEGQ